MPEARGPQVYSIAAHRGFADALVAGLVPRYREEGFGLARLTLLLPSRRTVRTVTEAFVRHSGEGLLLPRMAVVGDLDLDETLGPLLDPLGAGADIPPASDPTRRWLRLAAILREVEGDAAASGPALLRQAFEIARTMDRLLVEGIAPDDLLSERVRGIVSEVAKHWTDSTRTFLMVQAHWLAELAERGEVDPPARRNLLFEGAARSWSGDPPGHPIVAAGVTSASPALARLLRVVSELPMGAVILPDLDLSLDEEVWDALGTAGKPAAAGDPPFGTRDCNAHPQYHLKLLLNRMGIAREEVRPWHRAGVSAAPPERSKAISNLFLPPAASARWVDLPAERRRLSAVRLMETAHPGEEAQAIAILIRRALDEPEKRVALVTPDRGLAARVVAHLQRWGIVADDTGGRPLSQTAAGRVLLLLAEVVAESAAPVPLVSLLVHPMVRDGEGRAQWLDHARKFDLALRGPRPAPGLAPLRLLAAENELEAWWAEVDAILAPLFGLGEEAALAELIETLCSAAEALCGDRLWSEAQGKSLSAFVENLREAARDAGTRLAPADLAAVLRDAMDRVSVRPPWGGHPRVSVYGLLEARMSRADLVICGGLVEGVWPASPPTDALLPPAVLRALGVPGADFRTGLAAHDLAAALGAPEVVLSHAQRDEGGPVIPSRFVLRVRALLGDLLPAHLETEAVRLAQAIDDAAPAPSYPRPEPRPNAAQRLVDISATGLDRLRSDPYQFYAASILNLRSLDILDAEPTAAWKGIAVHEILEAWHAEGNPAGELVTVAEDVLDRMSAHPLMRSLWRPRLVGALEWIDREIVRLRDEEGRTVAASEAWGDMTVRGVRIHGRADRIDMLHDDALAIVDYKTGSPPTRRMVKEGFSLQLGLIGLIAQADGFEEVRGEPVDFEYWSLSRDPKRRDEDGFGFCFEPFRTSRADGVAKEDFLAATEAYLHDALDRWILGEDPFTARLNPDVGSYNDYDQLMRLDEWFTRLGEDGGAA
ncbi:double-strand break repair protein AddB [Novosphingobium marinum]|uniref:ATP-dependent helicase/nuclease subunit B n=1 Tax=Novosphingobium marinum TaxID=1514948 RepID=A0A7Y9XU33_9SPHN|nr:PD-(D/E)XK nuclease family protein [Novosphingobium marinum]NYH94555.1 ATP-dependent helicase/nuclease subunit B [Novosphingobium marinum]GGC23232.1 double-strand break repair protein AddB [Novosphingobium marinum]